MKKWSKKDIDNAIDKLDQIIKNETDIDKKVYCSRVRDAIILYVHLNYQKTPSSKVSLSDQLNELSTNLMGYRSYYYMIADFYFSISEDMRKNFDLNGDMLSKLLKRKETFSQYTGAHVSDRQAYIWADRFYKDFDPELYNALQEIKKNLKINFSKEKLKPSPTCDSTDGFCFFIDVLKEFYIEINSRDKDLSTYINLVHEYGHALAYYFNSEKEYSDSVDFFAEVASIFPELVACYEAYPDMDARELAYLNYCTLITNYDSANYIMIQEIIFKEWLRHDCKISPSLLFSLCKEQGISLSDLKNSLNINLVNVGTYIISYTVALELLNIYKKDKKTALEIYKKMLMFPSSVKDIALYAKEINFCEHATEECNEIVDNLALVLKKEGV